MRSLFGSIISIRGEAISHPYRYGRRSTQLRDVLHGAGEGQSAGRSAPGAKRKRGLKAKNTKTDEYRIVPVHNHLVEQGFLNYVESRRAAVLTVTFRHRPIRSSRVATLALQENVVLAPGNVFSVSQSAPDLMRVKVAQMNDPSNFKVLKRRMPTSDDRYWRNADVTYFGYSDYRVEVP